MVTQLNYLMRLTVLSIVTIYSVHSQVLPPDYEFVYPLACNFEESFCQWVQVYDDNFDWTRHSGLTDTSLTGPSVDNTYANETGYYVYIETSYPRNEDEIARLISPIISQDSGCSMTFYYHMYGTDINTLKVFTKEYGSMAVEQVWDQPGAQGNVWLETTVNFYNMQPFQVLIEASCGDGVYGDIAIDDISFSEGCYKGVEGKIRLIDSNSLNEGRIEIFHDNVWGTICGYNETWQDETDGLVVCRQLGYQSAAASPPLPADDSVPVHLDNIRCEGTEELLTDCRNNGWNVSHLYCSFHLDDVTVKCTDMAPPICHEGYFTCANQNCVVPQQLCDYNDDCGDYSDEEPSLCDQGDYPARCDFQDDLCNWIQVNTDDFDWLRHKGSTSTPNTGPNSDHSGNTDHYYMYMEATGNTIYDSTKLALAQQFKSTTDGSCKIRFFYHMYGTDVDELKLKMLTMTSHRETEIFKQDGNEGDAWHLEKITLNSSESFQLFFVAVVGRNQFADIAIDDISFTTGCQLDNSSCALPEDTPQFTCLNSGECISEEHTCDYHHNCIDGTDEAHDLCDSRPGQCDFQDGFCSWKQSCHDDFDWKRIKGQNSVAGPYRDHSLRNSLGFYAYIDASAQQTNEVAELRSLTLSTSPTELCKIRFYYYMYGTNFGTLKVIVKDKYSNGTMEKWAISGNQGKEWNFVSIDLANNYIQYQVLLHASVDGGDINIDDVSFTEGCHSQVGENAIRLVGGSSAHEGRVEVWYDGQWGTVCDDDFGTSDARVICLELGYPNEDGTESFGPGSGPIWLSHLSCLGNEASVFECHNDGLFNHLDCDHSEDAGVRCVASGQSYQIRLSGGRENVPFEGRVEIYHNGEWGTICDPTFGNSEAAVVCNQLGYDGLHEVKHFGPGVDPILIGSIDCCGHESSLAECEHSNWGVHTCSHSQDVGVICKSDSHPVDGSLRVVDGPLDYDDYQGRLQIYHDHEWGTICSLGWTTNSATVACKQLGFSVAIVDITDEFGEGNGPIHLSQVQCSGTESSLSACNVQWGGNSCDHSNDVGIKCANSQLTLSLLTDTTHNNEGCLHLQDNEGEKQVCLNGGTPETLTVICRELGFSAFHSLNSTKKCSPSGLSRVMSLANCVGDELQLTSCSSYAWISAKGLFCSDTNGDRELVCTAEMTTSVSSLSTQSLIKSTDLTPTSNPVECIFNIITTCNNVQHSATYSCTDRIAKIWSPNHPKIYETDRECSWKVQSTTQDAITIQFEAFMTEPNYDYLYIYDGNSVQSKSLGEYSGSRFPQSVTTSTNQVYIKFDSNHVTTLSGFKLVLSLEGDELPVIHAGPVIQQCCVYSSNEVIQDTFSQEETIKGRIKSPYYPNKYPSNLICTWLVSPGETTIGISFNNVDVMDDQLTVYDGNGVESVVLWDSNDQVSQRRKRYAMQFIQTMSNAVIITFVTNDINEGSGFDISYESDYIGPTTRPSIVVYIVIAVILVIIVSTSIIVFFLIKRYKSKRPVPAVRYVQNSDSEYAQIVDGQIYETLSRATASQGLANMAYQHEDAPPPYTARDDGGNAAVQNNKQFSCVPEINNGYALPTPVMHSHYEEPYSKKKLENSPKNEKEKKTFVDLPSEDVNRSTTEIDKRVYAILLTVELECYEDKFVGVSYEKVLSMTRKDLSCMNIPQQHQKIIMKEIRKLRKESRQEDRYSMNPTGGYLIPVQSVQPTADIQDHFYDSIGVDTRIPSEYRCPLTSELMIHPFTAMDNHTYERKAIMEWFEQHSTSPMTRLPVDTKKLVPNTELEKEIQRWRRRRQRELREQRNAESKHQFEMERPETPLTDVEC